MGIQMRIQKYTKSVKETCTFIKTFKSQQHSYTGIDKNVHDLMAPNVQHISHITYTTYKTEYIPVPDIHNFTLRIFTANLELKTPLTFF